MMRAVDNSVSQLPICWQNAIAMDQPWKAMGAGAAAFAVFTVDPPEPSWLMIGGALAGGLLGSLAQQKAFEPGPKWVIVSSAEDTLRKWKVLPVVTGLIGALAFVLVTLRDHWWLEPEWWWQLFRYELPLTLLNTPLPRGFWLNSLIVGAAIGAGAGWAMWQAAKTWRAASALGSVLLITSAAAAYAGASHIAWDLELPSLRESAELIGTPIGVAAGFGGAVAAVLHTVRLKLWKWFPVLLFLLAVGGYAVGLLACTFVGMLAVLTGSVALRVVNGTALEPARHLLGAGLAFGAVMGLGVVFGKKG
jgi:hypothetical protein